MATSGKKIHTGRTSHKGLSTKPSVRHASDKTAELVALVQRATNAPDNHSCMNHPAASKMHTARPPANIGGPARSNKCGAYQHSMEAQRRQHAFPPVLQPPKKQRLRTLPAQTEEAGKTANSKSHDLDERRSSHCRHPAMTLENENSH